MACVCVTRLGRPSMALAGGYAAPLLNWMVGLGGAMMVACLRQEKGLGDVVEVKIDKEVAVMCMGLMVILVAHIALLVGELGDYRL